jgi:hypothetical protein
VKLAVCPAVTVWFDGCVVIEGACGTALAVKFMPVTLVLPTVTFWLTGLKV